MSSDTQKARLIIIADMDNEPDEEQHVPLCMYKEDSDSWIDPETNTHWESIHVPVWR